MNSLKKYTKKEILTDAKVRMKKIASLLDDEDYDDILLQVLSWFDLAVYSPRGLLIPQEQIMNYKGGWFVDVTPYKIDVINCVYYQDTFTEELNTILPEVGLMPFILGYSNFSSLSSIGDYLALKSNLNMINRQMDLDGDFELWPVDEEGRCLLQLRNNKATRIEFLPNIDRNAKEWHFYDFEYATILDLFFAMLNKRNAELQLSASSLGIGKEATTLTSYWNDQIEKIKTNFLNSVMITSAY